LTKLLIKLLGKNNYCRYLKITKTDVFKNKKKETAGKQV